MKLTAKAIIYTISVSIVSVMVCAVVMQSVSIHYMNKVLTRSVDSKLASVRATLNEELNLYFRMLYNEMVILSSSDSVVKASEDLTKAFDKINKPTGISLSKNSEILKKYEDQFNKEYAYYNGGKKIQIEDLLNQVNPAALKLQIDFVINNPYGIKEKQKFSGESLGYDYANVHDAINQDFSDIKHNSFFYDIMIVNNTGTIIYSVKKEIDLGTSLTSGPFRNTNVARLYEKTIMASDDDVLMSDYEDYMPSYGLPSLFIATPIYDDKNKKRYGVLIAEVSLEEINKIMSFNQAWEDVGLGKTGEAYLVDSDGYIRSDFRLMRTNSEKYLHDLRKSGYSNQQIMSIAARGTAVGIQRLPNLSKIINDVKGMGVVSFKDYKKETALATFNYANLPNDWSIVVQMNEDEAYMPLHSLNSRLWGITLLIIGCFLFITVLLGVFAGNVVTRRILELIDDVNGIVASKDLTRRIKVTRSDEFALMTQSINSLIGTLQITHQKTVESTKEFEGLAGKIKSLATDIDYDVADSQTKELIEAGTHIEELSAKLRSLSRNFKIFAREARRTRGW